MFIQRLLFIISILFLGAATAFSSPMGITFTYPLITKDPSYLHGYRFSAWYQPPTWQWKTVDAYLDASYGHWWITQPAYNRNLNILALAPVARFYFTRTKTFSPFINASIGFSYLSRTRIDSRNLGMHFAFQDQLGIGAILGPKQDLFISASFLHYSNASLAHMNSGITVPLIITIGYRF